MELIKRGSTEGVWFTFKAEGAPAEETPAEFKIRRIPTGLAKETYFRHFGRKAEFRRKGGAVISDTDLAASQAHNIELACFALLDSRNAEVPAEYLKGTDLQGEGMVLLDGRWSDTVKQVVLAELPALAAWIVDRAGTLAAKVAEEESELGKTS